MSAYLYGKIGKLMLNKNTKIRLSDYSNNVFSQFGEDGIIEKIFEIVKPEFKTCIEFGAWDGLYLSNTANLWKNKNWKAVLIESDKDKFNLIKSNDNIIAINKKVDNDKNSLDNILEEHNIEKDIDFLSIDIDGNEYYIIESLKFKPKVICVEYNPTIPYWIDIKQNFDDNNPMGSSPLTLSNLLNSMNYFLVAATDVNMFFVDSKYKKSFLKYNTNISEIICKKYYNLIISKYNGKTIEITPFVYGKAK